MINIIKKSKRSSRTNTEEMNLHEAREFLYNIDARDFRISDFFVYSADEVKEIQGLTNYFVDDYLVEEEENGITIFKVNESITKYDRLRNHGATVTSINNFRDKIQEAIPESVVSIIFNDETFDILIEQDNRDIKIICNYQLEILKALVLNREWEFVDISESDATVKIVNKIFRKQRYYYKQKNG